MLCRQAVINLSQVNIGEWGRLVTILASLLAALFLYLIVKKRFGNLPAF